MCEGDRSGVEWDVLCAWFWRGWGVEVAREQSGWWPGRGGGRWWPVVACWRERRGQWKGGALEGTCCHLAVALPDCVCGLGIPKEGCASQAPVSGGPAQTSGCGWVAGLDLQLGTAAASDCGS